MTALLEGVELVKRFPDARKGRGGHVAVDSVSIDVAPGTTVAVVGESGAGKSTLGRLLLRLTEPDSGIVRFDGVDLSKINRKQLRSLRRRMQMIFQDPFSSLDPRRSVGSAVEEAIKVHLDLTREERRSVVSRLFADVGLENSQLSRYPHEFSGGQLQRVAIARALAVEPDALICDEPVAALDVSIRAQIINLLGRLQGERGFAMMFISHDMALVRYIADEVVVMRSGRIVERGATDDVFESPESDYTKELLSAIPVPDPRARHIIRDQPAGPTDLNEATKP